MLLAIRPTLKPCDTRLMYVDDDNNSFEEQDDETDDEKSTIGKSEVVKVVKKKSQVTKVENGRVVWNKRDSTNRTRARSIERKHYYEDE
ncbi:MAG: hypothetical protein EZS28_030482 [Streblomastix strix]|uniref:Uncharacterized protein n=1 Tax=Streblomastix strix TaxID=222440 RepID=A0A5J4UVV8_9EUKA|nr:MAG: hypothetical protein EZS28_030482 [Streblomastix strix]